MKKDMRPDAEKVATRDQAFARAFTRMCESQVATPCDQVLKIMLLEKYPRTWGKYLNSTNRMLILPGNEGSQVQVPSLLDFKVILYAKLQAQVFWAALEYAYKYFPTNK